MESSQPSVGIVVLNYNGQQCLLACLQSLSQLEYRNFFVVVVDNASTDDSLVMAKSRFPDNIYIRNTKNTGFASGMNVGIRVALSAGATWVWLCNNDAIVHPSALGSLVAVGEQEPRSGLLSPCIYDGAGKLWFGKGRVNYWCMRVEHVSPSESEQKSVCYESEFLTGCALLMRREVLERVGFLDERFFLYYEDADYCMRVRGGGYRLLVVPMAQVFHREQSEENDQKVYFLVYSGLKFFKKHARQWQKWYFFLYGTMRRLKNAFDLLHVKKRAVLVRQAFHDFDHDS